MPVAAQVFDTRLQRLCSDTPQMEWPQCVNVLNNNNLRFCEFHLHVHFFLARRVQYRWQVINKTGSTPDIED